MFGSCFVCFGSGTFRFISVSPWLQQIGLCSIIAGLLAYGLLLVGARPCAIELFPVRFGNGPTWSSAVCA